MSVVRFRTAGNRPRVGFLEEETVADLGTELPYEALLSDEVSDRLDDDATVYDRSDVELLLPIQPETIARLDNCYRDGMDVDDHLGFLNPGTGPPSFWAAPESSLARHGSSVSLPELVTDIRPGVELGVVIGAECSGVDEDVAASSVAGYTVCRTFTAHDEHPGPYGYRMFSGFLGVGPAISSTVPDDATLHVACDDRELATATISNLRFSLAELVSFTSHVVTLQAGDLVTTGNPTTVDKALRSEQSVVASIDGIGRHRTRTMSPEEPA